MYAFPDSAEIWFERKVYEIARKASLPVHISTAAIVYYQNHREAMQDMNQKEAATALLFIFAKNDMRTQRTLDELCEVAGSRRSLAGRYVTRFAIDHGITLTQRRPEDYIVQNATKLNLSRVEQKIVVDEAIAIVRRHMASHSVHRNNAQGKERSCSVHSTQKQKTMEAHSARSERQEEWQSILLGKYLKG